MVKNRLTTGILTSSDTKTHSDYKGSSIGIGASGDYGGAGQDRAKMVLAQILLTLYFYDNNNTDYVGNILFQPSN